MRQAPRLVASETLAVYLVSFMARAHIAVIRCFAVCVAAMLSACNVSVGSGNQASDTRRAELAIQEFHARYNQGLYSSIRDNAYPHGSLQAMSAEQFLSDLQKTLQVTGLYQRIVACRFKLVAQAPVQVQAICNTQFEKGVAHELFVFDKNGDELQLADWRLRPGAGELPKGP